MWKRDEPAKPGGAPAPAAAPSQPATTPAHEPAAQARPAAADTSRGLEKTTVNIGKSVVIKGELNGSEDLTIEGQVEGKIELRQNVLTIGANGRIKAQVFAKAVIILGEVTGNVTATEKVDIRDNGSVDGDIASPRVAIAEGAHFRGAIDMQRAGPPSRATRTKDKDKGETKAAAPAAAPATGNDRSRGRQPLGPSTPSFIDRALDRRAPTRRSGHALGRAVSTSARPNNQRSSTRRLPPDAFRSSQVGQARGCRRHRAAQGRRSRRAIQGVPEVPHRGEEPARAVDRARLRAGDRRQRRIPRRAAWLQAVHRGPGQRARSPQEGRHHGRLAAVIGGAAPQGRRLGRRCVVLGLLRLPRQGRGADAGEADCTNPASRAGR